MKYLIVVLVVAVVAWLLLRGRKAERPVARGVLLAARRGNPARRPWCSVRIAVCIFLEATPCSITGARSVPRPINCRGRTRAERQAAGPSSRGCRRPARRGRSEMRTTCGASGRSRSERGIRRRYEPTRAISLAYCFPRSLARRFAARGGMAAVTWRLRSTQSSGNLSFDDGSASSYKFVTISTRPNPESLKYFTGMPSGSDLFQVQVDLRHWRG